MKLFLFFLLVAPAFAGELVMCLHPDDEKMKHSFQPSGCRPIVGHGGVFKADNTVIDVCEQCRAQHSANPDQCKVTQTSCSKKRPTVD